MPKSPGSKKKHILHELDLKARERDWKIVLADTNNTHNPNMASTEKVNMIEALREKVDWNETGNWAKKKLTEFEQARERPEGWT